MVKTEKDSIKYDPTKFCWLAAKWEEMIRYRENNRSRFPSILDILNGIKKVDREL